MTTPNPNREIGARGNRAVTVRERSGTPPHAPRRDLEEETGVGVDGSSRRMTKDSKRTASGAWPARVRAELRTAPFGWLLLCLLFHVPGRAQTGEVRGFVAVAQGNEPLRSVEVSLTSGKFAGSRPVVSRHARTGLDGRFRFSEIPLGDYSLSFKKDGYEAGSSIPASVTLSEDAPDAELRIGMRRSAAISGSVLDADGDPVAQATVQLYERMTTQGLSRLQFKRSHRTNDLGEYRLSGLSPGRYFAAVLPLSLHSPRGVRAFEFPNVYYPNAGSIEESEPIAVSWGSERVGIDFRLPRAMRTSLEGAVFHRESRQPCPGCNVNLIGPGSVTVAAVTPNEQGLFAVRGLHPGSYRLVTQSVGGGFHAEESVLLVAGKTVDVELATSATQDVVGRIVAETAPPEDNAEALHQPIRVRLESAVGAPSGRLGRRPTLAQGGAFRFTGVTPGSHHVSVRALPRTAYVRQMLVGGRPLKGRQISIPRDAPLEGLEIRIAFDGGGVRGTVSEEGLSASGASLGFVVLLPDLYGEGWHFERLGNYRPGDGAYEIGGVPPGSYIVLAIPRENHFDLGIAEDLRYLRERGRRVRVAAEAPFIADRE